VSDQEDSKSPGLEHLQSEWARVLGNPDNLIVSDSLRSALPDEFTENDNASSILEITITLGDLDITAPMTRMDLTRGAWLCQLSVDASDAAVLLSFDLGEIRESTIELKDKGNTIKMFDVNAADDLALSVDTDGQTYFVTLSCEKKSEDNDESAG